MDAGRKGSPAHDDGAGPFDALVAALCRYDVQDVLARLAPDVVLTVPPLRIVLQGSEVVARGLVDVAFAFDGLVYHLRGRYLTPGSVTDEAVVSGIHNRDLLGAPPTGREGSVPMRVIVRYDGVAVTRVDFWPDVAAVRGLCDETAAHIDARIQGTAGEMVTALRALMPAGAAKVVHGSTREVAAAADPASAAGHSGSGGSLGGGSGGGLGAGVLGGGAGGPGAPGEAATTPGSGRRFAPTEGTKLPVPRKVRRRRAIAAGLVMLTACGALVAWVAHGALNSPTAQTSLTFPNVAAGTPTSAPTSAPPSPAASSAPSTSAAGSPSVSATPLQIVNNQVSLSSDFLFETGSFTIAPAAKTQLLGLIALIKRDNRVGLISVTGYTDNVGKSSFNLSLSQHRADAVALLLSQGLPGWQIVAKGKGMGEPIADNATAQGRAMNRRVTVKVPPPRPKAATPATRAATTAATTAATAAGTTAAATASTTTTSTAPGQ